MTRRRKLVGVALLAFAPLVVVIAANAPALSLRLRCEVLARRHRVHDLLSRDEPEALLALIGLYDREPGCFGPVPHALLDSAALLRGEEPRPRVALERLRASGRERRQRFFAAYALEHLGTSPFATRARERALFYTRAIRAYRHCPRVPTNAAETALAAVIGAEAFSGLEDVPSALAVLEVTP